MIFNKVAKVNAALIIIYNLYRGKAPVTRSDFQGGPLRVKIKYTKAKNIQYN